MLDDCSKTVLSDTRQDSITPIGNVLKIKSQGKEKRASLSTTRITSPPQIRHTSDLHPEWESEIHYIKVRFLYPISFSCIPWAPYSTSINCNRNGKKASPDFTPKRGREGRWCKGKHHCRGKKKILERKLLRQETKIIQATLQQEKGQDLLATKVTWINHCPGGTMNIPMILSMNYPILNIPTAESSPGSFTFCEAADWFQDRAGFCANITNPLQRPEVEQLVLPSTFFTTVQPQELSSCLVMDALVPNKGFLEGSRSHAVFTWTAANLEKGQYRRGGCGPASCPLPSCASCHEGRSTQTSLSNFFISLK